MAIRNIIRHLAIGKRPLSPLFPLAGILDEMLSMLEIFRDIIKLEISIASEAWYGAKTLTTEKI